MTPVTDTADDEDFEFDLWDELRGIIAHAATNDPRSLQVEIGPSGLGTPCVRKLAHRLADTPPVNTGDVPWRPTVGRAVHSWLEGVFTALNEREFETMHRASLKSGRCKAAWCDGADGLGAVEINGRWHKFRYLTEFEVPVGTINGRTIFGHIDLYDRMLAIIDDWKIAGPKSLKDHHAHGMGDEYRVQQHTYAYGVVQLGLPVKRIAVTFLPMNGELKDGYVLSEPYDPSVRKEAFRRARVIEAAHTEIINSVAPEGPYAQDAADAAGMIQPDLRKFFRRLKTAPDYCARCPWFAPGATDFEAACPGDPSLYDDADGEREFEGLI